MNIDAERKAFEAWAAKNGYSIEFYKDSWGYRHDDTADLWQGWLARAQLDTNPPKEDGE